MQTKIRRQGSTPLTRSQQTRLAEIRSGLERHRALGVDVSAWEAEFFLGLIDGFIERLKRAKAAHR